MKALYLMVGIPGSGKTTVRNTVFSGDVTIICPDDLIGYSKEDPWTPMAARNAWKKSDQILKDALTKDDIGPIIFDATFVSAKRRRKYITMAKQAGVEVFAIYCRVDLATAVDRNNKREVSRRVPQNVIDNMWKRLEVPGVEEGLVKVFDYDSTSEIKKSGELMRAIENLNK